MIQAERSLRPRLNKTNPFTPTPPPSRLTKPLLHESSEGPPTRTASSKLHIIGNLLHYPRPSLQSTPLLSRDAGPGEERIPTDSNGEKKIRKTDTANKQKRLLSLLLLAKPPFHPPPKSTTTPNVTSRYARSVQNTANPAMDSLSP